MASFTAQLQAFQDHTEAQANEIVLKVVLEIRTRLIVRSPVDTGRFRNNWQYGLDYRPGGEIGKDGDSFDRSGAPAADRILGQIPVRASGHVHFLANNVSYAQALENGGSSQAPNGMVGLTLLEFPQIVERATRSVAEPSA